MTISKLLFELSGETRLEMLHALETAPITFTKIADQMDITSSEASRQIERLIGMDLIEKLSDGSYAITPLGRLMLLFLPGIDFVYKNSDFFLTHDTAKVPRELVMRFGDLSGASFIEGTIETMNFVQGRMRNAERYHYGMADGLMRMMIPLAVEKIRSGIRFGMILPDAYREELSAIVNEYSDEGARMHTVEIRTLSAVPLCVGVTDMGCGFKLPGFDGEIDHSVMVVGMDPAFCGWCRDLHAHYWEQASPV